ncbi:hypothetical protein CY34DRAFT_284506 [Suillus luteus UH-Slu-Lm8-n1]|uniref:Uncharacterized protein n=1 Tax=Suillus luteus UH-Slu-Lm8-n1 TaxID=930992 RepID=A0A0D0B8Q9_9AGAM|nr:hypothetical protein CY34DRAFT_284506 [Suillus luteus UH-Slu-Lm8-n1]
MLIGSPPTLPTYLPTPYHELKIHPHECQLGDKPEIAHDSHVLFLRQKAVSQGNLRSSDVTGVFLLTFATLLLSPSGYRLDVQGPPAHATIFDSQLYVHGPPTQRFRDNLRKRHKVHHIVDFSWMDKRRDNLCMPQIHCRQHPASSQTQGNLI